jgi:hypothetical protein
MPPKPFRGTANLSELPPPPPGRSGWPWTDIPPCHTMKTSESQECPSVTVITPSFNQAEFIEETIRSVLLQGYPTLEYIVVDGGSTDGTVKILQRYEPWLRWISERDAGQADAINKGLRLASGDVLSYLNSDDLYLPGGITAIARFLGGHPEEGLVYGECKVIDERAKDIGYLPRRPFNLRRTIERAEFLAKESDRSGRPAGRSASVWNGLRIFHPDCSSFPGRLPSCSGCSFQDASHLKNGFAVGTALARGIGCEQPLRIKALEAVVLDPKAAALGASGTPSPSSIQSSPEIGACARSLSI